MQIFYYGSLLIYIKNNFTGGNKAKNDNKAFIYTEG
jgi:hypothetical protein